MKLFAKLSMVSVTSVAIASGLPLSAPEENPTGYDTMDQAAVAAENVAMKNTKVEFGGSVYFLNGKYYYTKAVTENSRFQVNYRVQIPINSKLVAMYHTHPGDSPYADQFSTSDIIMGQRMNMILYVAILNKNHMLKFDPSKDHVTVDIFYHPDHLDFHPTPMSLDPVMMANN